MDIALYQGAASLAACQRWQEIIAQNIGSSAVPGYKKIDVSFESVLGDSTSLDNGTRNGGTHQGVMPKTVSQMSLQQGDMRSTNNELDFAIQGNGFFQVQRPNGELGYTRNGGFQLTPERTLITRQGMPVMGDGGPITLRAEGGRLSIDAEGTLIQGETPLGKIAIYDFNDPKSLKRIGDGLLGSTDANAQPKAIERPSVLIGYIEGSNVAPLQEMVNLISVSRAYEATQKMMQSTDELSGKAIATLGNPN